MEIIINEWISVEDRLPKFDKNVIVFTAGGVTTARLDRIDYRGPHWEFNESNTIYWLSKPVTHWMDLPAPPEKN